MTHVARRPVNLDSEFPNSEKLEIDEYTDAIPDEKIEDFFKDEL